MKILTVTGLSNEQDFLTGESSFVLILNKDIRITISEAIATKVIQEMYQNEPVEPVETGVTEPPSEQVVEEDDGIDQI